MNCQVFSLVALDDVLWLLIGSMVGIALKHRFGRDLFNDGAPDDTRFRIPSNVIADLECFH